MTEQALPARFAIYRKNTELFEIFKQKGAKIVFEDPLGVPLWHVVKKADLAVKTCESTIGSHVLSWTYVGAALVAAVGPNAATGHLETIPVVQFSKNTYLPHSIRGVRTMYRDGLRAGYFGKKYIGLVATKAVKPVPEPVEVSVQAVKQEPIQTQPEQLKPIRKRRIVREVPVLQQVESAPPSPIIKEFSYDDEDPLIDESKGFTCLAALALFFITCFYAHYTNNHMKVYNFQNFEEDIYWGQFP
jgi:hypothetical protein